MGGIVFVYGQFMGEYVMLFYVFQWVGYVVELKVSFCVGGMKVFWYIVIGYVQEDGVFVICSGECVVGLW